MHVCLAIDRGGSPLIERSQHFVLTRFNVNIGPHRRTWDDAWLASRFRLFEEYCLPSMRSQTSQQFTWLIFFATSSRATIERYLADVPPMPNLQPVFTDTVFGPATTREAVISRHDGVSDRLITTRLDCDDALRSDFVQRLQAVRPERPREVFNFPLGYQVSHDRFYLAYDPMNAFCTLTEPWDERGETVQTVYGAQHQKITDLAPVRQVDWKPSWLQVVHDLNLANTTNGLRVSRRRPTRYFSNLPAIATLASHDDLGELVADQLRTGTILIRKLATRPEGRRRLAALLHLGRQPDGERVGSKSGADG